MPLRAQSLAEIGGTPVLPHDRVRNGLAVLAVPDDRSFALIGDADSRYIRYPGLGSCECFKRDRDLRRRDLFGIVFDPSGLRKNLVEFALGNRGDRALLIEQEGAGAGGALIEREDVSQEFPNLQSAQQALILPGPFTAQQTLLPRELRRIPRRAANFLAHRRLQQKAADAEVI